MWLFVDLSQLFKKNSGGAIVLMLLCLYPYIQLFHYVDYCAHKNQIVIEQTVCQGFTWEGDRYYNGMDRLNFSVDVRFKGKEVAYIVIHTVVRKDGRYVGYIKTEFTGNCTRMEDNTPHYYFERRTRQTLDFYMEHITGTSWSGEELMEELRTVAMEAIERCQRKRIRDWSTIKSAIKNDLSGYLYKTTKRNPMILPVIMEI